MPAPQTILDLVSRFGDHIQTYKSGSYNETQLRRDFLDPFFKALGWDVDNEHGYDERYRDVIHEDQVKVGGAVKAPDYGFRIGGNRKFFLEAKKPSVRIKEEISPAYQLRRYAWSAKLPLSILSDFEEFAIYDCRLKPSPTDAASKARIFYCRYDEYEAKWDEIASIFSKEAILKGGFDKYAATTKGKRGTTEVDASFLATIEGWRADLARNLALRNPALSQRELNFSVQRVLDRIIFLRICEDRGIEDYERLKKAADAKGIYPELMKLFQQADDRYNSGLFHFRTEKGRHEDVDTLTPTLSIDDALLKGLLRGLYYPDSPYEFSVFSADILGQVYEQFLGKVITLSTSHKASVEDKPEVKKAGGVFYTPTYIVDYIVRQTVGPLVENKTPKQIESLTVLDPACGSGSFLIGAYQFFLDWYLAYYTTHDPETLAKKKSPVIVAASGGGWALTTNERKRILLAHTYGVDIDSQAVEVTKLSLLLKVLEGETSQTVQRELIHERVLPDLADNIKCGNSLIGSDFYDQPGLPEMDTDAHLRINVFDWDGKDGFPEIMKGGGFDAVVGNPPYLGGREWKEANGCQYDYFIGKYEVAEYQFDIYALFIEQTVRLVSKTGYVGLITPNTWLNNQSNKKLRRYLLSKTSVATIADYSSTKVFKGATVLPIVSILQKQLNNSKEAVNIIKLVNDERVLSHRVPQTLWDDGDLLIFNIDLKPGEPELRKKISIKSVTLESMAEVKFGIKLYETGKGSPPQKPSDATEHIFEAKTKVGPAYRPYLEGKDVDPYQTKWASRWLKYGPNLAAPRSSHLFEGRRLVFRRIVGKKLIGTLLEGDFVTSQLLQIVKPNEKVDACYLLGVLNSTMMAFYFKKTYNRQDKTFPEIRIYELASLPIRTIDPKNKADQAAHDRIVALVEKMLSLHPQRAAAKTPHEQTALDRQISATDKQIDQEVYALYGLTAEEIALVEASA